MAVEPGLVDAVLDQVTVGRIGYALGGLGGVEGGVGGNGKPAGIEAPFLQLVMQRVWEVERTAGSDELRAETLDALGGAQTVVADHLERAMAALAPQQQEIAAQLFNHLVTPSGSKIAHGVADLAEYARVPEEAVRPVVASLAEHRILRPDESGRYEIFHDVLAAAVLGWRTRYEADRAVERARAEARRRHRRLGFLAFGALVALALMAAVAVFAYDQRGEARQQARVAQGRALVASAFALQGTDPELAVLLALDGSRVDGSTQSEEALRSSLAASHLRGVIRTGHPVIALDVDHVGRRAITVGDDGIARVFDLHSRRELWHRGVERGSAAFASDGNTVLLAGQRSLTRVDAASGEVVGEPVPIRTAAPVVGLVPSPDGVSAALLISKPRAPVVLLRDGSRLGRVKQPGEVTGVAFAPDGRQVVSGGRDGAARLWDVSTWTIQRPFLGHVNQVRSVAFDPRGNQVATASSDGTARVWPTSGDGAPIRLSGHTNFVNDVAFGESGSTVTASTDATARTWGASGRPIRVLRGHSGAVTQAEFATRRSVVTAGEDGTLRLWDPGTAPELVVAAVAPPRAPARRAVSPDRSVSAVADGRLVRLTAPDGEHVLDGHSDVVNAIAFSPDSSKLVTAGRDHDAVVVGRRDRRADSRLEAHLAWSPTRASARTDVGSSPPVPRRPVFGRRKTAAFSAISTARSRGPPLLRSSRAHGLSARTRRTEPCAASSVSSAGRCPS